MGSAFFLKMKPTEDWLSLADLGRIYGISAFQCGRVLEKQGLRDRFGRPTSCALEAGIASTHNQNNPIHLALWNVELCRKSIERNGYQPISRKTKANQWAQFLEALAAGSPSVNVTPEQMAEDVPEELVGEVNDQLAQRGCDFRLESSDHQNNQEKSLHVLI